MQKKPSNETRQLLLDQGLLLVASKGLRGLTVRELAARSGVNLGSFVYHFGQRERFIAELVERWYAPVYEQLRLAMQRPGQDSALARLRSALLQLIALMDLHAPFVSQLLLDALAGEAAAQQFLLTMPARHPKLMLELIAQAQHDGEVVAAPPLHLLVFLMSSVGLPLLLATGPLKDMDWLPAAALPWQQHLAKSDAARERLDWALRGIALPERNP